MNTIVKRLPALALAAVLAGCGGSSYVAKGEPIKAGLSMAKVETAILEGAKKAGWQTLVESPGVITATYPAPGQSVVTEITYDEQSYEITYMRSSFTENVCPGGNEGSTTQTDCQTGDERPANVLGYQDWMEQLNKSIGHELNSL